MSASQTKKEVDQSNGSTTPTKAGARLPTGNRTFLYLYASNICFVIAATLYVYVAADDLYYERRIRGIPMDVLEADDDETWEPWWPDDDYVFDAPRSSVSSYMMVYFMAALMFVVVGLLDFVYKPGRFGAALVLAGLFGVGSSMVVEQNEHLSDIFDLVSVHLFLIEAVQILYFRTEFSGLSFPTLLNLLHIADASFCAGAVIDVILSYFAVTSDYSVLLARIGVVASVLWLVAALIYVSSTVYIQRKGGFKTSGKSSCKAVELLDSTDDQSAESGKQNTQTYAEDYIDV